MDTLEGRQPVSFAAEMRFERLAMKAEQGRARSPLPMALDNATFDLMLVDIFMPHMRGFESIRIFHERRRQAVFRTEGGHTAARDAAGQIMIASCA